MSVKTVSTVVLVALFVATVTGGIVLLINSSGGDSPGIEILLPTTTPTPELKVYVTGAVAEPGVYSMREGQRLVDVIAAAGGAVRGSQLSCINLAIRVTDEAHYHVPGAGEPCQTAPSVEAEEGAGRIDLNTATPDLLETLPNIGEVIARAIVDYREKNGPFKSIEDVMEVPRIGPATFDGIRELIYVGGVAP